MVCVWQWNMDSTPLPDSIDNCHDKVKELTTAMNMISRGRDLENLDDLHFGVHEEML